MIFDSLDGMLESISHFKVVLWEDGSGSRPYVALVINICFTLCDLSLIPHLPFVCYDHRDIMQLGWIGSRNKKQKESSQHWVIFWRSFGEHTTKIYILEIDMYNTGKIPMNLLFSSNHVGIQKELGVSCYVDTLPSCCCLKGSNNLQDSSNSRD